MNLTLIILTVISLNFSSFAENTTLYNIKVSIFCTTPEANILEVNYSTKYNPAAPLPTSTNPQDQEFPGGKGDFQIYKNIKNGEVIAKGTFSSYLIGYIKVISSYALGFDNGKDFTIALYFPGLKSLKDFKDNKVYQVEGFYTRYTEDSSDAEESVVSVPCKTTVMKKQI